MTRPAYRSNWFLFEACRFKNCRIAAAIWVGQAVLVTGMALLVGVYPAWMTLSALVLGLLVWSPVEYVLHRFVMHWVPLSPSLDAWVEKLFPHAFHHRHPNDPGTVRRQQYPMAMIFLFFLVTALVVPVAIAAPFYAGIGLGYLCYELVHFAIHQCPMHGPIGRVLKRNHLFHHTRDDTVNFGLTSPAWDHAFGTHFLRQRVVAGS